MNEKDFMYFYGIDNASNIEGAVVSLFKHNGVSKVEPVCNTQSPNIAFFCPELPRHDMDSGSNRMLEIIKLLHSIGCNVYLFTHETWPETPKYKKMISGYVTSITVHEPANNKYLNKLFDEIQNSQKIIFDIIYYYGYEIHNAYNKYIFYLSPTSKIITDSVDVHWSRFERSPNACPEKVQKQKNLEINSYNKSDIVFAVTVDDKNKILEYCPTANVKILSNIHKKNFIHSKKQKKKCLFVGGEKHTPNIDAVIKAVEIINEYNNIHKDEEDLCLDIVGKYESKDILNLESKNIKFRQYISEEDLNILYGECKFSLSPLTWGSGIKGKVCESVCKGVPVVTTSIGNEGVGLENDTEAFICEGHNDFIEAIDKCLSMNKDEIYKLTNKAMDKINLLIGVDSAKQILETTCFCKHIVLSILTHNNAYMTEKLLRNIISKTSYPNYHIYITSDRCRDNTKSMVHKYQKKYPGLITYQYNTKNLYFILSHNNVIKNYPDSDVVIMNEDIEIITDKWLTILYNSAYSSSSVGCVGGKSLDSQGNISEAGAQLYNNGSGENMGRGCNRYAKEHNYAKNVGYVSGCLWYIKNCVLSKIGPMDRSYYPCYYEDSDWQYSMHLKGYTTLYNPQVEFIHREGSSCGTSTESGLKKYMKVNKEKFQEKFKNVNIEEYN